MKLKALKKTILSPRGILTYRLVYITVGLLNFFLILFDYFYLEDLPFKNQSIRDTALISFPSLASNYDRVKGIEPHRFTESMVADYQLFKKSHAENNQDLMIQLGTALSEQSRQMIDAPSADSPFASAKGSGSLEVIKNRMRRYYQNESAKDSFREFFLPSSPLDDSVWQKNFAFYEMQIMPLLKENYYRSLDEDGKPYDHFYELDRWFVYFFIFDFISRWFFSIAFLRAKWYFFLMRRWYEVFNLFYPHHAVWFRFMRALPLYMRIRESGFLTDDGLMQEIIHDNASVIAKEISSMVLSNLLIQGSSIIKKIDAKDLQKLMEGEKGEHFKTLLRDVAGIVQRDVLPYMSDDAAAYLRGVLRNTLDPWLTTPVAPVVRLLMLNLEISIQDSIDAALVSEEASEEQKKLLAQFFELFMDSLSDSENFSPVQKDLSSFMESLGRELGATERNDYIGMSGKDGER